MCPLRPSGWERSIRAAQRGLSDDWYAELDRDTYLLYQVHPAKLAADGSADVVSTWLMWQRRVPAALLAGFLPAGIGSAIVSRRDLSGLRRTRPGHYVLTHMPPSAQAVRFAGQLCGVARRIPSPPMGNRGRTFVDHGRLVLRFRRAGW